MRNTRYLSRKELEKIDRSGTENINRKVKKWFSGVTEYVVVDSSDDDSESEGRGIEEGQLEEVVKQFNLDLIKTKEQFIHFTSELNGLPKRLLDKQIKGDTAKFYKMIASFYTDNKTHGLTFPNEIITILLNHLPKTILFPLDQADCFIQYFIIYELYENLEYLVRLAFKDAFFEGEKDWLIMYKKHNTIISKPKYMEAMHEWMWGMVETAIVYGNEDALWVLTRVGKKNCMLLEQNFRLVEYACRECKFEYLRDWFEDGGRLGEKEYNSLAKIFADCSDSLTKFLEDNNEDLIIRVIRERFIYNKNLDGIRYTGYHISQIMKFVPKVAALLIRRTCYPLQALWYSLYYKNLHLFCYQAGLMSIETIGYSAKVVPIDDYQSKFSVQEVNVRTESKLFM